VSGLLTLVLSVGWVGLPEADRDAKVALVRAEPLQARVVALSEAFLGTPYELSPLGEGEGQDPDPLVRYDAVDCLTLVEEVMAMSLAPDAASRLTWLGRIRYSGAPAWQTRNHIMEAQWLPKNLERGLLRDVTREYGGRATRTVTKRLTPKLWAEKNGVALGLPPAAQPQGTFSLDVVPAEAALRALAKAPSGLVVVVVRADRPNAVTRVSHVGFLIQTPQGPVLRHASRTFKRVTDEPLAHYMTRNLDFGRWTIEGLALFEVQEPASPD
jgi:hypothetical protein